MFKKNKGLVIGGGIAALVLILGIWYFTVNNGVTNAGNTKEAGLNVQYLDNQNYLSDCIVRIRETAGVAQAKADKLDQVLEDAIKGRYDNGTNSEAQPDSGKFFSAIQEAYPDLQPVGDLYNRVFDVMNGCRTDYRGKQTQLLDMLRSYDTWRTGSFTVRTFGGEFPSDNLEARVGDDVARGQEARDRMYRIVLAEDALEAYESGTLEAEDPFGNSDGGG